jgi:hypothetical protein
MVKMNYEHLDIWRLANEVAIEIHKMTLKELPAFEMYETGSQIRRSSKSVKSNIVEGFGRRKSKRNFFYSLDMHWLPTTKPMTTCKYCLKLDR